MIMAKSGAPEYTHRRLMRSVRIMLRALLRFRVPKRCRQSVSEDQGSRREEDTLPFTSPLPRHSLIQITGRRLLHGEPSIREVLSFTFDESQPTAFLPRGNTIRFREYAYMGSTTDQP